MLNVCCLQMLTIDKRQLMACGKLLNAKSIKCLIKKKRKKDTKIFILEFKFKYIQIRHDVLCKQRDACSCNITPLALFQS